MKTRNGFVSNSSSSSFLLIAEKNGFDKAMRKMHGFYASFITHHMGYSEKDDDVSMFMGKKVVVLGGVESNEDTPKISGFNTIKSLPKELQAEAFMDNGFLIFDSTIVKDKIDKELTKMGVDHICITESC